MVVGSRRGGKRHTPVLATGVLAGYLHCAVKPNLLCPICQKISERRPQNRFYPFCSARCRQVDLGKWLGEEYRVASQPAEEQEDELPTVEDDPQNVH